MATEHGIETVFAVLRVAGYEPPVLRVGLATAWLAAAEGIDDDELMARLAAFVRRDRCSPAKWPRPSQLLGRVPSAVEREAGAAVKTVAVAWAET